VSQPQPPYPAPAHPQHTDPSRAYLGHPAVQHAQLAVVACRFCGSVPAAEVTFRGHQGIIVMMRFLSLDGPFCRDCGLATFRRMTSRTLIQGWFAYASFVITPITVLVNLVRRAKVASLPAPHANPYAPSQPPMDAGPRLLQRPMTWAGLAIPVVFCTLVVLAIVTR